MARGFFIETTTTRIDISVDPRSLVEGGVCDKKNSHYVAAFLEAYFALLDDGPLPNSHKPRWVIRKFMKNMTSTPLRDSVNGFVKLADRLMQNTFLSGGDSITGEFIPEMRNTPIFWEYHHWFTTGNPVILQYILTFLRFGKKIEYIDKDLESNAFREWLLVEQRLSDQQLPEDLSALKAVVQGLLPPLDTTDVYPRFGPGAVAESGVRGFIQKSNNLLYDDLIDRVFFRGFALREDGVASCRVIPDPGRWWRQSEHCRRVAVARLVYKDMYKYRSICMEPNTIMYFQQVVHDWLRLSMKRGPLRDFIFIEDQSYNQRGAVHGSTYGSVDTIDLSSASDSVGFDLVKAIFPEDYLNVMDATRTQDVLLPNGEVVAVRKFAPMGSACCFPTQCIIFASIVVHAMMLHASGLPVGASFERGSVTPERVRAFLKHRVYKDYTDSTPYNRRMYEAFRVYGDDIICDTRVTDHVLWQLTALRFAVNTAKSFTGSQALRESCGVYAWNGEDVTPVSFKVHHFTDGFLNPSSVGSLIDFANLAGDCGLRNLQRNLIHRLLYTRLPMRGKRKYSGNEGKNPIPFTSVKGAFGIFVKCARNSHLKKREFSGPGDSRKGSHVDWQRTEFEALQVVTIKKSEPHPFQQDAVDRYQWLQWQRARRFCDVLPDFTFGRQKYRPEETGVSWDWIPAT